MAGIPLGATKTQAIAVLGRRMIVIVGNASQKVEQIMGGDGVLVPQDRRLTGSRPADF